jgi:hypothetical protein
MHWKQWDTPPKYFRPADSWECGRLRSGFPCSCGPDQQGKCRIKKSENEADDPAASKPCKPRRSLWWRRRRLSRAMGVLVAGILISIVMLGRDKEVLAPGELASPHAQILSRHTTENRCAACHELNATESVVGFLAKSWTGHTTDRSTQSIKCLDCHQQTLPNGNLMSPHDLPTTALAELTRNSTPRTRLTSFASSLPKQQLAQADLACSTCHIEHQGRWNDLTMLSNERCQSCHQNRFNSFTNGHPEFTNFPVARPESISFNHQSHSAKHFASKGQAFDCRSCHLDESQPSAVGPVGRSVSYEKACANCHDASLRSSFSDGILVINLPSFDREKIEAAGLVLGTWPAEASLMTDGKLSPMLRWLLAGDQKAKSLLQALPTDGNVAKLSTSDPESLKVQVELAGAIRRLIEDLAIGGQPEMQKRLAASLAQPTSSVGPAGVNPSLAPMVAGASPDIFRSAYQSWFAADPVAMARLRSPSAPVAAVSFGTPSNGQEAAAASEDSLATAEPDALGDPLNANDDPLSPADDPLNSPDDPLNQGDSSDRDKPTASFPVVSPQTHLPQGGWMVDQRRIAIVYVPNGHSDSTVKAWLTAAATMPSENHFSEMLAPKSIGACTECHKLSQDANVGALSLSDLRLWRAEESDPAERKFTRFNHVPHLTLPQLTNCTSCHAVQENGHFKALQMQNCLECHTKQGAGDHCTQCHNYHIKMAP